MVYVSKRLPASTKTTSLSKPWESVARTQRRRERACDGSPSRKTNWPVLRISALSRDSIPVVMPGWRSRGRLLPRRVWYSIWSSGSLRSSGSLHFRLVRRRLPGGRREALQLKTLSSSKPQLGQVPSNTSLIFLGLTCCFDRTRASSQRIENENLQQTSALLASSMPSDFDNASSLAEICACPDNDLQDYPTGAVIQPR